jgi:hypothetical protein
MLLCMWTSSHLPDISVCVPIPVLHLSFIGGPMPEGHLCKVSCGQRTRRQETRLQNESS